MKFVDLTGRRYGRLTVDCHAFNKGGRGFWKCTCDCGSSVVVATALLNNGNTSSCGCLHREAVQTLAKSRITHGKTKTPLYSVWHGIRKRCNCQTTPNYDRYGGRGIQICAEWNNFSAFEKWAQEHEYKKGLSIDRIDNDGNYEPDNCRIATAKQQARNRGNTIFLHAFGETKPLSEWAEIIGINDSTLRSRVSSGSVPFTESEIISYLGGDFH